MGRNDFFGQPVYGLGCHGHQVGVTRCRRPLIFGKLLQERFEPEEEADDDKFVFTDGLLGAPHDP